MCALLVYFHSCLHCIRCCCLATSLKLLWKHPRWFKNRWLWVHVMSKQNWKKKQIEHDKHFHPFRPFGNCFLKIILGIWCLNRSCVGCDVLFQRQTDTHSLTNLPSGHPLTPRLSYRRVSRCGWMVLFRARTSVMTQKFIEKRFSNK